MSSISDKQILDNGNLPAGVTERDTSGGENQFPSLRQYLDGDVAGRVTVSSFQQHCKVVLGREIIDELSELVGASDRAKLDFVKWAIQELQLQHERLNG